MRNCLLFRVTSHINLFFWKNHTNTILSVKNTQQFFNSTTVVELIINNLIIPQFIHCIKIRLRCRS
ncbi:hypothetical protein C2G38_2115480 [Gigaspora rosea]|uniref:Uncharacterized protein n=1 Tax=Gigaspora rosea TaxID=44941 RepID=A0A397UCA8_9GLOM|nr:hypothetical protein C2G38_2115480 [Gigaspora rosea]